MSAGIFRLEVPLMSPGERERIRRACIEEGLLDEDDLYDLEDVRIFSL